MTWGRLRYLMVLVWGLLIVLVCCLSSCEGIDRSGLGTPEVNHASDASINVRGTAPFPPIIAHPVTHDAGLSETERMDSGWNTVQADGGASSSDAADGGDLGATVPDSCSHGAVYPCNAGLCACP